MTAPTNTTMAQVAPPAFRKAPLEPDPEDGARLMYAWSKWDNQTAAWIQRDRTVEECVRMLCGQQDIVWSSVYNRFVDIGEAMTNQDNNADIRWRHRPRINLLSNWYTLTKAG